MRQTQAQIKVHLGQMYFYSRPDIRFSRLFRRVPLYGTRLKQRFLFFQTTTSVFPPQIRLAVFLPRSPEGVLIAPLSPYLPVISC